MESFVEITRSIIDVYQIMHFFKLGLPIGKPNSFYHLHINSKRLMKPVTVKTSRTSLLTPLMVTWPPLGLTAFRRLRKIRRPLEEIYSIFEHSRVMSLASLS